MLNGPVPSSRRRATGDVGYFALWVDDIDRAAEFYTAVLGWTFVTEGPTRRRATNAPYRTEVVALAEMRAAAWPDRTAATAFCAHQVEDLDAAADRIRAAGGRTQPRRRGILDCVDDQGLPFSIFADDETYAAGALAYLTVEVPSIDAAEAFYSAVFDWQFRPGSIPEGRQVEGPTPMTGFAGGHSEPTVIPMFAVDDIAAAVARVRAAGGTATDPERYPYGTTSDCTDDQGLRFYLGRTGLSSTRAHSARLTRDRRVGEAGGQRTQRGVEVAARDRRRHARPSVRRPRGRWPASPVRPRAGTASRRAAVTAPRRSR